MATYKNISDQRFGRLVVMSRDGSLNGHAAWRCRCDCGNELVVVGTSLRKGETRSCGCLKKEIISAGVRSSHGMTRTPTYIVWIGIKARCHNPAEPAYPRYGGRGIEVCERWRESFENFLADMGERPSGKSLDRYPNNDGNYEPGNCRWATSRQQMNNRNNNRNVEYNGKTMTVTEWERELGMPAAIIKQRLYAGWSIARALTTPPTRATP